MTMMTIKKHARRWVKQLGRSTLNCWPLTLTPAHCYTATSMSSISQRPVVFFDINIGETPAGRMKMELFSDIVPKWISLSIPDFLQLICVILEPRKTSGSYVLESLGGSLNGLRLRKELVDWSMTLYRVNARPQGYKNCIFHRYVRTTYLHIPIQP